jgi:hypothetical protein
MIEISYTAHSDASRDAVWGVIADLTGWQRWGPWVSTELDGDPAAPLGALRTMRSDRKQILGRQPYTLRERITAFEPGERFAYDLLSGLPVRNYHAEVELSDAEAGGTDIRWHARFDPPWPIMQRVWRDALTRVVYDVSTALAAEAERVTA